VRQNIRSDFGTWLDSTIGRAHYVSRGLSFRSRGAGHIAIKDHRSNPASAFCCCESFEDSTTLANPALETDSHLKNRGTGRAVDRFGSAMPSRDCWLLRPRTNAPSY
jgi:hypothetical protein